VFLGGDGRAATPAAGKTETATGTVIVRSAGLPTFAVVNRVISADVDATRGCIDKILRKNISPKIKCKVCIL
jgi:hypothetical protein